MTQNDKNQANPKSVQIRIDATRNLQNSELKNHSLTNTDFELLSNWTYLAMFILEARTSLKISESLTKDKFENIDEVVHSHGMFRNGIMAYAKCFTSSGAKRISLDPNEIFSTAPELKDIHERIMNIRHSYVAHNSDNDIDIALIATIENDTELALAQTYTISKPTSELKDFYRTIEHCEKMIVEKFNKKIDKIESKINKKIRFE